MTVSHPELEHLLNILRKMQSAVLAYSGGVDSTLLMKALALSGIQALAVTGVSPTTPPRDLEDARQRPSAVTGIRHAGDATSVPLEKDDLLGTAQLPEPNCAVHPAGQDKLAAG